MSHRRAAVALALAATVVGVSAACSGAAGADPSTASSPSGTRGLSASGAPTSSPSTTTSPLRQGVYAHDGVGMLSTVVRKAKPLVYVPDSLSDRVDVIDPTTFRVVRRIRVGREPQHVVPSFDLKTLWVNDDKGNDLVPIDPVTGRAGRSVPVADPYNLYFTPDGAHALVMAERLRRIDVRDPRTMKLQRSLPVPCRGVNHADFAADGSWLLASCEFSGKLLVIPTTLDHIAKVIDLNHRKTPRATGASAARAMGGPAGSLDPGASAMPQDVRITDDGRSFVVADMLRNGVWVIDVRTRKVSTFLHTGHGAHGVYPSRDARRLFVSNRDGATISVLDATGRHVLTTWRLPRGSSPDMGGVSADGSQLWLSGRYDSEVYVISTRTGRLLHTITVGDGPHGLAVWPQPGRHSLGHTGNMR